MPILNVKVSGQRSDELTRDISRTLVEITTRVLGKNPALMAVAISYVDPRDWVVGGRSLSEQAKSSFFLDIKVVDETNTKAQKAEYVREAFEAFKRLLPDLHEESYVHLDDARPTAYGYGGRTQEFRYHHPPA
jgi:4-oxalocrotonate tautomerase